MFTVIGSRPASLLDFATAQELLSYLTGCDSLANVDVTPHHHHFHVRIDHAPTMVQVETEPHAHALAEIFRKAGYHDVTVEGNENSDEPELPSLIDSVLDALLNGKNGRS